MVAVVVVVPNLMPPNPGNPAAVVVVVPNLLPPNPGNPAAVVVVVVLAVGNFPPNIAVDNVPVAGVAVVFANPENELEKGVAAEITGATEPKDSPVPAEVAATVVSVDGKLVPPRVNPPVTDVF